MDIRRIPIIFKGTGYELKDYVVLQTLLGKDFPKEGDPLEQFDDAVRLLNDRELLPSFLSGYCDMIGISYNSTKADVDPEEFNIYV